MARLGLALVLVVAISPCVEARADLPRLGIFRKKKEEPPVKEKDKTSRAKELLDTLKSDPDESRRLAAVQELSGYDPRVHLDLLPTLLQTLRQDPSEQVRAASVKLVGELRPVVQNAGVALEQSLGQDPSEVVRKAAQQALWQYHLNGYRTTGAYAQASQTAEPPLARPRQAVPVEPIAAPTRSNPVPAHTVAAAKPVVNSNGIYQQTVEPPLAKPRTTISVQPPQPTLTVPPLPSVPAVPAPPAAPSIPPPNH